MQSTMPRHDDDLARRHLDVPRAIRLPLAALAVQLVLNGLYDVGVIHLTSH